MVDAWRSWGGMRQHKRQSQVDAYLELLGRECRGWERLLPLICHCWIAQSRQLC